MATKKLIVYVKHEEGDDETRHMSTRSSRCPRRRPGPVEKLLAFAVDTYNGKHADTPQVKTASTSSSRARRSGLRTSSSSVYNPRPSCSS